MIITYNEKDCGYQGAFACSLLQQWLEYFNGEISIVLCEQCAEILGSEGYRVKSISGNLIEISAGTENALTNGIYGFLFKLKTRQIRDPFLIDWDFEEKPQLPERRITLAAFAMDCTSLTPDAWALPDWIEYIDFIRSFNINRLTIFILHHYHPEVPDTIKNKWRFDLYREVIRYAHKQGIKVNLALTYNHVPSTVNWSNPGLRTDPISGYFGISLCWSKGKETIMKYITFMLDYLNELDGVEIMVTEALGWCMCSNCKGKHKEHWIDAVNSIGKAFRKNNPQGEIVFWNWLAGYFPALKGVYPPTDKIEDLESFQPYLLERLPRDTVLIDISRNQADLMYGALMDGQELPEILEDGTQKGYKTLDIVFFIDIEFGMLDRANIFPKPFLDSLLQEYAYLKTLHSDGSSVYRLVPKGSFLSSFISQRLAWNPDLKRHELLSEIAGYLTENEDDKKAVISAVNSLEKYWRARNRLDLLNAAKLLENLKTITNDSELEIIKNGTEILCMVDEYARIVSHIESNEEQGVYSSELEKKRNNQCMAIFEAMKRHEIYRGYTSDGYWEPRAIALRLRPALDSWANFINHMSYGVIVERPYHPLCGSLRLGEDMAYH